MFDLECYLEVFLFCLKIAGVEGVEWIGMMNGG